MSNYNGQFYIQTERRKEEAAAARQHRMVKEAQRAGMKTIPLIAFPAVLQVIPAFGLIPDLARLRQRIAVWNCRARSRFPLLFRRGALADAPGPCGD